MKLKMEKKKKRNYTIKVIEENIDGDIVSLKIQMCKKTWDCLKEKKENPMCRLVLLAID